MQTTNLCLIHKTCLQIWARIFPVKLSVKLRIQVAGITIEGFQLRVHLKIPCNAQNALQVSIACLPKASNDNKHLEKARAKKRLATGSKLGITTTENLMSLIGAAQPCGVLSSFNLISSMQSKNQVE